MTMTKVFKSGNSQAVRLPREFRVEARELEIFRRGDEIVLREPVGGMSKAFEILASLPDELFPDGRDDPPPQDREGL